MRSIAERHKKILERLAQDGFVRVDRLSEELGVSEVTIRKDLKSLENRNMLFRSHGSASSVGSFINERHIDEKENLHKDEKERIARAASKLVQNGDKIIIASGTTLFALAKALPSEKNFTVITSSIKVSRALCYRSNVDILQLGGMMRKSSASVIGFYAEDILRGLVCNKLFIGVDGIDIDHGLTTSDLGESRINQRMIDISEEVIVVTDSSKFGKRGFTKICGFERVHQIITDSEAPPAMVELLREKGIKVTLV